MITSDTIVALSTPPGVGAIGVIRLSGKDAITICDRCFKGKALNEQPSHTLHFGPLMDGDEIVDEVVVGLFKAPKSYTMEDVVEISCHGSPFIQEKIIQLLIRKGARAAKAGEFTLRAFLNGRLDLSQAEAVAVALRDRDQAWGARGDAREVSAPAVAVDAQGEAHPRLRVYAANAA